MWFCDGNRRHDNHRQDMWRFGVRRLGDLMGRIIPFFEQYPLRTAKAGDFTSFAQAVRLLENGVHLKMEGLQQSREHRSDDEPQKAVAIDGILRGHTPAT